MGKKFEEIVSCRFAHSSALKGLGKPKITTSIIKTKTDQLTPVFEYGLGVQGEEWWCCERYRFSVRAGWEQQVWLDMNQFDNVQDTPYGNLGFQGLTASARFGF